MATRKPARRAGKRERLAVIAARGADDAGRLRARALEPVHIDEPAAQLEGAGRRVVLVLDEDLRAGRRRKLRPGILRRRRHHRAHDRQRRLHLGEAEQRAHASPIVATTLTTASMSVASSSGEMVKAGVR